jgi:hypothetical protein
LQLEDAVEDDVGLIFFPENEMPSHTQNTRASTPGQRSQVFRKVDEILKNGIDIASEQIDFRSAVDFPYYDKCPQDCRCGGALHLNLQDGILERAWVFKVAHNDDARLILHGHTFLPWSERKNEAPENRADRLTSLNWRLATRSKKGHWESDPCGQPVLPVNPVLRQKWRSALREKSASPEKLEASTWSWRTCPLLDADRDQPNSQHEYEKMEKLLKIAGDCEWVPETYGKRQTDRLVRAHVGSGNIEPQVVNMADVDVFTRRPRQDLRAYGANTDAPAAMEAAASSSWEGLHVAALCIGLSHYKILPPLPNARNDVLAFTERVNALPNSRAELLEKVETRKEFTRQVSNFLDRLKPSPPKAVLITFSGHGGTLANGNTCLIPSNEGPESPSEELDSRDVFEVAELLSLCREKLDIPARDKGQNVSFIIVLDCCRVAIPSMWNTTSFEPERAPIIYTVYYSCRQGGEAEDGLTGAYSPFAKELLDPNGIFSKGRSLEEGLKEAGTRVQEKTRQKPMHTGSPAFPRSLCLYPDGDHQQQQDRAVEPDNSSTGSFGDLWISWCSFKDDTKNELAEGRQRFRGETVVIAKGCAVTKTNDEQNSQFRYDARVSKAHMQFKFNAVEQKYQLHNQKPTLGTWKRISEAIPLYEGMIFKVGTDMICEGKEQTKVKGFDFNLFWASCFKVISISSDR